MTVNSARVRLARELRGLTQAELAERAVTSQGRISKLENGITSESDPEFVAALGNALSVVPEFLYIESAPLPLGDTLHFRKQASAPKGEQSMLTAEVNVRWEHVRIMLQSMDVPPPDLPEMEGGDGNASGLLSAYEGPEAAAARVREYWRIPEGPISNLTNIAESRGVVILLFPFPTDRVSGLSFWAPLQDLSNNLGAPVQPVVCLNATQPACRLRFSLAHELGHLVMHRGCVPSAEREEAANRFACELLMPAAAIRTFLPPNLKIPHLAVQKRYWLASMAALLKRASDLKCISERKARHLWMEMGSLGYRTQEPVDIPLEVPNLVTSMIAAHMGELAYSEKEMAALLNLRVDDFRAMYNTNFVSRGLRLLAGRR